MLGALRLTDRVPALGRQATVMVVVVLLLDAVGALALGLLASAAVADPSQATLALPMLCFPAVLFGGAVLPTEAMAVAGQAISAVTADRWAFEALGRAFGMETRFGGGTGSIVDQHALTGGSGWHLAILAGFALLFLFAALRVLARRTAVRRPIARQCRLTATAPAPATAVPVHLGLGSLG
jgi:ABC-type multidrug transport system permease subunit